MKLFAASFVPGFVLLLLSSGCVVTDPCGDECRLGIRSACTCAPDDPCNWRFNGVCDDQCLAIGANPFDDAADCTPVIVEPCGGACNARAYNACTCAPDDPCGYRNDGVCDDACYAIGANPLDDAIDCPPVIVDPCNGECSAKAITLCTCAPEDPCGYIGDGICDDACYALAVNPLDDAVDCGPVDPCGGECSVRAYSACTCAPDDPCGFVGDGVCDDACYAIGSNPIDDVADCGPVFIDDDGDGIEDLEELWFAETFAPTLAFAVDEAWADRYPSWAVEPTTGGISIFYALSYYDDGGEDATGETGFYGDPEFVVVEVVQLPDESWDVDQVFLSAYYGEVDFDVSGWYPAEAFAYDTSDGGIHPIVYAVSQDHAMFPTLADCDAGGWAPGLCDDQGALEVLEIYEDGNLGNPINPLWDEVVLTFDNIDYSEFYFTPVPFCGWWVEPGAPRDGCALNDYATLIGDWLAGAL